MAPSLSSCLSLVVISILLLFIFRNVFVALYPLVHLQSNPLLLFVILFYLIEHQTNPPPPHPTLLTSIMCLRLLQGCYDFLSSLHLSPSLLLGLFLCLCGWTKVYTHVSEKVSLHTHFEIAVKFVFACLFVEDDQTTMKLVRCCFASSLSTILLIVVNVVNVFFMCLSCFSFLLLSLICSATSLSIAFHCIMFKFFFEVTPCQGYLIWFNVIPTNHCRLFPF